MKKFIYLCGMMLITTNIMAQIDLDDQNWKCFIDEDFSIPRYWDSHWEDQNGEQNYQPLWKCFADEIWWSGVIGTINERHAYQRTNVVFSNDSTLKLIGELKSQHPMKCSQNGISDSTYSPAPYYKYCHKCDSVHLQHPYVHYYTGMIETIDPVGYGYYEIECKMPVHNGAYSAFWFWSNLGHTYNEIDVFEHSTNLTPNLYNESLSGIWYNPFGATVTGVINDYGDTIIPPAQRLASHHHFLPENSTTLDEYHKFGCLWMPERVTFYVDGIAVNDFNDPNMIPPHPMWLKITHVEDFNAKIGIDENNDTIWGDWNDEMTIKYVKAYRLKTDCTDDIVIRNISDFNSYVFSTKHTIIIRGENNTLAIPYGSCFTMRAAESITIDKSFEISQGSEMTLIVHDCPECSMEDVVIPTHNCRTETETIKQQ